MALQETVAFANLETAAATMVAMSLPGWQHTAFARRSLSELA